MSDWQPDEGPYEWDGDERVPVGTDDEPLSPRAQQSLDEYDRRNR